MVKILQSVYDNLVFYACLDAPIETCGYLAGTQDLITHVYPLHNKDQSPEHFSFLPEEQFTTIKDVRNKKLFVRAVYHSHPATPARPSAEDIRLAYDPNILYVIVSLATEPLLRAFRIVSGVVTEEVIEIQDTLELVF